MTHTHACPRCLADVGCDKTCELQPSEHAWPTGLPSVCPDCRKAGRNFSAAEVAAAAGCSTAEVKQAHKRGHIELYSLASVSEWVSSRRREVGALAGGCYAAALRELRLAGAAAQELPFGLFLWVPEGGGWAYSGELAGPLKKVAHKRLVLPPFSTYLTALVERCERGPGYDDEAVRLRHKIAEHVGMSDPVLARIEVRAARRNR